ncbi:LysR family transcriptional regulator [Burkholderia cepacia]|uniref:LysR family transcriptional regulator n=1 Tax=Burkholderia cepacia TaxID=292 RepID=A0A8I1AZN4_BURCE|nr:LysR family transcriptional regulator [Burkholderia cepacia]MBA9897160.1 LysR family transcriptional regulator [Burkholderia cepacia]MBA9943159.1 LysR family transcriptional regulator [Burkholderia cepacia]MBA9973657.1 LysR family transcriptional regulator [Burkholderia cepacia]MBA9992521.1 LysR family transcriptional regulator [Burkholderia cepacia]MBA9999973.1 LysR family transcriptional regulator [Burkholderia cepacia]
MNFSLNELACLEAVIAEGSFQAAAGKLHRTHPAVYAAVKNLESRLGVALLDRSQYRVGLTPAGEAFRRQAAGVLGQAASLETLCEQLIRGEETDLRVVVGDLTPTAEVLKRLKHFFKGWPRTRLHLHFEVIGGPWERLLSEEADLIIHHIDKSDTRFDWIDLSRVTLVPVAAPDFLAAPVTRSLTQQQMSSYVQVVIRDSAKQPTRDYFVIQDAPNWTVADQHTKKELIVQGMGWGHMPLHLIDKELRSGKLVTLEGRHFKRSTLDIVAARLRGRPVGPVATALWRYLCDAA